jgi:hypothetical protein
MTTGADLYNFLQDGIDQAYSGYMNEPRANDLLREAEIKVAEKHYSTNKTQKTSDELSPLTVLDRSIPVRANRFRTLPFRVTALTVVGTIANITVDAPHSLLVGDAVTVASVQGFAPGIDGQYVVASIVTPTQFTIAVPAQTGAWATGTGSVTTSYMIPDMVHPLAIRPTFIAKERMSIEDVVIGATPYLKFNRPNFIREDSLIRVTGGLGVVGLNGDFYCKFRNRVSYYLYTDEALSVPAVLSGTYQGSGQAVLVVKEQATVLRPDARISYSTQNSDEWTPKFGISENGINLYPKSRVCENVEVDYMKQPPVTMDVLNTDIDLELYYTFKYLMRIKDEAVNIFLLQMRELQVAQAEVAMTQINP